MARLALAENTQSDTLQPQDGEEDGDEGSALSEALRHIIKAALWFSLAATSYFFVSSGPSKPNRTGELKPASSSRPDTPSTAADEARSNAQPAPRARAAIALTCENMRRPDSAPLVLIHAPQAGVSAIGSVRPDGHWSRATDLQYEGLASSSTVRFATMTDGAMPGELLLSTVTGEIAWSYAMTGLGNARNAVALRCKPLDEAMTARYLAS